mmetsp:Transcript_9383/g.24931  ORF Transcript_9383/g.24931 Transcript_9383/m.24931 type:complete len:489 (-) Transcript_9383:494-1960(-)
MTRSAVAAATADVCVFPCSSARRRCRQCFSNATTTTTARAPLCPAHRRIIRIRYKRLLFRRNHSDRWRRCAVFAAAAAATTTSVTSPTAGGTSATVTTTSATAACAPNVTSFGARRGSSSDRNDNSASFCGSIAGDTGGRSCCRWSTSASSRLCASGSRLRRCCRRANSAGLRLARKRGHPSRHGGNALRSCSSCAAWLGRSGSGGGGGCRCAFAFLLFALRIRHASALELRLALRQELLLRFQPALARTTVANLESPHFVHGCTGEQRRLHLGQVKYRTECARRRLARKCFSTELCKKLLAKQFAQVSARAFVRRFGDQLLPLETDRGCGHLRLRKHGLGFVGRRAWPWECHLCRVRKVGLVDCSGKPRFKRVALHLRLFRAARLLQKAPALLQRLTCSVRRFDLVVRVHLAQSVDSVCEQLLVRLSKHTTLRLLRLAHSSKRVAELLELRILNFTRLLFRCRFLLGNAPLSRAHALDPQTLHLRRL